MKKNVAQLLKVSNKLFHAAYDYSQWSDATNALTGLLNGIDIHFSDNKVSAPVGNIKTDGVILFKQDSDHTTLFNAWLAHQDSHRTMQVKACDDGQVSDLFTFGRGGLQPNFDADDLALIQTLIPTLQNVATLQHKLGLMKLDQHCQTLSSLNIGLIIVDQHAHVLRLNTIAEQLLNSEKSLFVIKNKKLKVSCASKNTYLQKYIFNAGQCNPLLMGQELLMPIDDSPLSLLSIFVSSLPNAQNYGLAFDQVVSVLIKKVGFDYGEETKTRLMNLFGLSHQEAVISTHLLRELSLQQAADREQIGIATARTYLSRIFRKTHTQYQSQLLALLVQVLR